MGRATKMEDPNYQGERQPGCQRQDMSKGGPKMPTKMKSPAPSSSVAPRGVGKARNKQCKMY